MRNEVVGRLGSASTDCRHRTDPDRGRRSAVRSHRLLRRSGEQEKVKHGRADQKLLLGSPQPAKMEASRAAPCLGVGEKPFDPSP